MEIIKQGIKKLLEEKGYSLVRLEPKTINQNPKKSGQPQVKVADSSLYENYSDQALEEKKFYNVGSGNFFHPFWTNVDYGTDWYKKAQKNPFIEYNLMNCELLPLEDHSAEIIYTSHTIEHITDQAALNFFKESYRTLKPGGGIRITCPDAHLCYDTISTNDRSFWQAYYQWMDFKAQLSKVTIFDFVVRELATSRCRFYRHKNNEIVLSLEKIKELYNALDYKDFCNEVCSACYFRDEFPGDHINWWDENKVTEFLEKAGFTNTYVSRYGQSKLPPLRNTKYFDNSSPMISLYIEALK